MVINTLLEIDDIIAEANEHRDGLVLLLVGFDGVLVDYEGDPDGVRLSSELRDVLHACARRRDLVLGIVSGRRVRDLKASVALGDDVFYVGLHGLEVEGPGFARVDRQAFDEYRECVHEMAAALEPFFSTVTGVRIEDKEAALALHTREAGSRDAVWARLHLLSTAAHLHGPGRLRVVRGNHVIELMPPVAYPRAAAITRIRRHLEERAQKPVFIVYVGDDVPDDDAFDAVDVHGVSAAVGQRARRAQYHLPSTTEVRQLIERLAATPEGALTDEP